MSLRDFFRPSPAKGLTSPAASLPPWSRRSFLAGLGTGALPLSAPPRAHAHATHADATAVAVTPYEYGARYSDASIDESTALQAAINAALKTGLPLDLAGGKWRIETTLEALGDLHLRNGEIHTSIAAGSGLEIKPLVADGYTSPTIENVKFYKVQHPSVTGLLIQRGHSVFMSNVDFENFRNGESTAIALDEVQVLTWRGGFVFENDRHLDLYGNKCTDIKISNVWFQDSKSQMYAGVTMQDAAGVSFTGCSFDIARYQPLVSMLTSKNITFHDCRFEKPSYPSSNTSPAVSYPAVDIGDQSERVNFLTCYFSNTQPDSSGANQAEVVRIGGTAGGHIALHMCSFPASSPPITTGAAAALLYRSLMNTGLADN
ncbi:MAG: right-handed parallel beta-helix repeat-containing protein [Planctomycetota bacterium]|nr:right-handed parallel beta-helix repeat-containing protein [Planctomycetota bacterium]